MSSDIYVRAYAVPFDQKEPRENRNEDPKWPDYALIFDCESQITADLTLTFGFWRFTQLRNGIYAPQEEGILYDEGLGGNELNVLRNYARTAKSETTNDGCDRLRLYSHSRFVHEVLGIAIQARALIVCFNAGFDLARLAVDWEIAENGGWSLILSQWRNPKTQQLEPNKFFPRIVIKALNSKTSIIHSTRAPMSEAGKESHKVTLWPRGRFLDLRTILWSLRNRSYSLQRACEQFGIPGKLNNHRPSGRVDLDVGAHQETRFFDHAPVRG